MAHAPREEGPVKDSAASLDERLEALEDRFVRQFTVNAVLIGVAATSLIIGAIAFSTGIILAIEAR